MKESRAMGPQVGPARTPQISLCLMTRLPARIIARPRTKSGRDRALYKALAQPGHVIWSNFSYSPMGSHTMLVVRAKPITNAMCLTTHDLHRVW